MSWRVGGKVPLNVYEGERPMFQCHTPEDAERVVEMLNGVLAERERCVRIVESFVKQYWFDPDMPEVVADLVSQLRAIRSGK